MSRARDFMRGWRTLVVNLVAIVMVGLDLVVPILGMPEFLAILPTGWAPYVVLGLALVNLILRADTRTPMGRGE